MSSHKHALKRARFAPGRHGLGARGHSLGFGRGEIGRNPESSRVFFWPMHRAVLLTRAHELSEKSRNSWNSAPSKTFATQRGSTRRSFRVSPDQRPASSWYRLRHGQESSNAFRWPTSSTLRGHMSQHRPRSVNLLTPLPAAAALVTPTRNLGSLQSRAEFRPVIPLAALHLGEVRDDLPVPLAAKTFDGVTLGIETEPRSTLPFRRNTVIRRQPCTCEVPSTNPS